MDVERDVVHGGDDAPARGEAGAEPADVEQERDILAEIKAEVAQDLADERPPAGGPAYQVVSATFVLLIGLAGAWLSYGYGLGSLRRPGPGLWPFIISCLIVVLAVVLLVVGRHLDDTEKFTRSSLLVAVGKSAAALEGEARIAWGVLLVLGNGFIVTALFWGSALVAIIEQRLRIAGAVLALAALATLFGVIHSPLPDGAVFWPWAAATGTPATVAAGYGVAAAVLLLLGDGPASAGAAPASRDRSRT